MLMRNMFAVLVGLLLLCVTMIVKSAETMPEGLTFLSVLVETWGLLPLYAQIIGVLWLMVPVFSLIVSLTDTPMDDNVWGKWIYPILEKLALVTFKSKQKAGDGLIKPLSKSIWREPKNKW